MLEEIRRKISHIVIQFHAVEQIERLFMQGKATLTEYNETVAVFLQLNSDLQKLILDYINERKSHAEGYKK